MFPDGSIEDTHLTGVAALAEGAGGDGVQHEAVITSQAAQHLPAASLHALPVTHHQLPRRGSVWREVKVTGYGGWNSRSWGSGGENVNVTSCYERSSVWGFEGVVWGGSGYGALGIRGQGHRHAFPRQQQEAGVWESSFYTCIHMIFIDILFPRFRVTISGRGETV